MSRLTQNGVDRNPQTGLDTLSGVLNARSVDPFTDDEDVDVSWQRACRTVVAGSP